MRFSMLFALTLVSTLSFAFDAQARERRRNRNRDCCETRYVAPAQNCCGTAGYHGQAGYVGGYAVNSFGVATTPLTMPMPGVVRTDGTTIQPSTGIVQTSGTTAPIPTQQQTQQQHPNQHQVQQVQQPMHSAPMVATQGVYGQDCGCPDGYGYASSYGSDSPRRRGLFRGRR